MDVRVGFSTWKKGDPRDFRDVLEEADRWMYRRGQEETTHDKRRDEVRQI